MWVSYLQFTFIPPSYCVVLCCPSRALIHKNMSTAPTCLLDHSSQLQCMCLVYTVANSPCTRVFLHTSSMLPTSSWTGSASTSCNKCHSPIHYATGILHNCDNCVWSWTTGNGGCCGFTIKLEYMQMSVQQTMWSTIARNTVQQSSAQCAPTLVNCQHCKNHIACIFLLVVRVNLHDNQKWGGGYNSNLPGRYVDMSSNHVITVSMHVV